MTKNTVLAPSAEMEVKSVVLGTFRIPVSEKVIFPQGILGFPNCHEFALVPGGAGLYWLQSLQQPTLAFLMVDPFSIAPDYSADIPDVDVVSLGARNASDVALLSIVTLPRTVGETPTANLQGPIAFNMTTRRAKQVITGDTIHGVRWAFRFPVAA